MAPAPNELAHLIQWVCWDKNKVPKNPQTGCSAKSNKPQTWGSYFDAVNRCKSDKNIEGVGFMFSREDDYFGVDLDNAFDEKGVIKSWAKELVDSFDAYTEFSPSGKGLHIIGKKRDLELYKGWKNTKQLNGSKDTNGKKEDVEIYTSRRYFTFTGRVFEKRNKIRECQDALEKALSHFYPSWEEKTKSPDKKEASEIDLNAEFPQEKFESLRKSNKKFRLSWNRQRPEFNEDDSSYDFSLATIAVACGWTDSEVCALIRMNRERFDQKNKIDREDYYRETIKNAKESHEKSMKKNIQMAFGESISPPPLTDAGNAERFAERFRDELKYVTKWKCWLHWNGVQWKEINERITEFAIEVAKDIKKESDGANNLEEQEKIYKWVLGSQSAFRLNAMIKLARGKLLMEPDRFDNDPWLLNCRNGILDLKQGKLIPHDPQQYLTKLCDVEFDPEAECPRWTEFINEITCGNQELIQYLQRLAGYCLTGETIEQAIYIFQGPGLNGKTTFLETLMFVLGDYAVKAQADSFMKKKNERINNDIAGLAGARLVIASEIAKGRNLDEPLIKELTGGDSITARKLYAEYFTYKPQFKILLGLNDEPQIEGGDNGIWRRIRLIKFNYIVPKNKVDKYLMSKLKEEAPGILAWAFKGCMDWQKDGLAEPEAVQNSTQEYRGAYDPLQNFLDEKTEDGDPEDPKFCAKCSEIYEEFKKFSKVNGWCEISKPKFGREMAQHGYISTSQWIDGNTHKVYKGLRIKERPSSDLFHEP